MHAFLLLVTLGIGISYAGVLAALFWLQGRLVYPLERLRRRPFDVADDLLYDVTIHTDDGLTLSSRYRAPSREAAPTVILFHGNGDDIGMRAHIAHALVAAGYGVFQAEYRGYGGNPGTPHEAGLYLDARAAYAFVAGRARSIVLHGYSLGSGVATQLALETRVDALVLESPFTSIVDVAAQRFPLFPVRPLARDRYDNLSKIAAVSLPLLIYGGANDGIVPPRHFSRLHDAARQPKQLALIQGADHIDIWTTGGDVHVLRFLHEVENGLGAADH
ncbi:alpha/beta hydrolase [Paraburkholderia sp. SIMBA_049]